MKPTQILKMQLAHNMKIESGFLPALAKLIPFLEGIVLPALRVGALSGLARTGVQKLIGNGMEVVCDRLKLMGKVCILDQ